MLTTSREQGPCEHLLQGYRSGLLQSIKVTTSYMFSVHCHHRNHVLECLCLGGKIE